MRNYLVILIAFVVVIGSSVSAQSQSSAPIIEQLSGTWVSGGDAFGVPARTTMRWEETLGGKFFRLDYRIEMQREGGAPSVFEGVAYYRHAGNEAYTAYWADNGGELHPIKGEREGNALIAHWGAEGAKQGRTRYQLLPNGAVEVTDWIKTAEGWRQFNKNSFVRNSLAFE